MAQGYTTTVNAVPSTFAYDRRLLDRLVNSFVYIGFGEEKSLKANMGTQISFRRYTNLTAATTALTEGVTPAGSSMAKTDYSATVAQYGDYVTYTDWVDMVGVDANIIKIIDDLQADQAADTLDQKMRAILDAATNVVYTTSGQSADTGVKDLMTATDLDYVQNQLERNNVKYLAERTKPGVQIGTVGLDPGYILICHPDVRVDIEGFTGFIKRKDYPVDAKVAHPNEFGTYKRIKCIWSTNAYLAAGIGADPSGTGAEDCRETSSKCDIYYTIVFGKGAFGNVRLDGGALKTIVKPLGYKDPLNQEGSVGWKATFAGLILDQNRIWKISSGAQLLTN